ncbi:MAG: hypothetical protein DBW94_04595 [Gammaproteobacteria bacterium]|nr:MAG: hypothetical protein DBW94_04595 [Gammaproteobacteria bacterium]|tara:strand:- start:720 stop:962 length:243 start_codon:yes stop_codon:yes gene_type:complete
MKIAVDISLYPLDEDFIPPIKNFIHRLNNYNSIEVITNNMSTQIIGEYEVIMSILNNEIRDTFEELPKAIFAVKILNNPS